MANDKQMSKWEEWDKKQEEWALLTSGDHIGTGFRRMSLESREAYKKALREEIEKRKSEMHRLNQEARIGYPEYLANIAECDNLLNLISTVTPNEK